MDEELTTSTTASPPAKLDKCLTSFWSGPWLVSVLGQFYPWLEAFGRSRFRLLSDAAENRA